MGSIWAGVTPTGMVVTRLSKVFAVPLPIAFADMVTVVPEMLVIVAPEAISAPTNPFPTEIKYVLLTLVICVGLIVVEKVPVGAV